MLFFVDFEYYLFTGTHFGVNVNVNIGVLLLPPKSSLVGELYKGKILLISVAIMARPLPLCHCALPRGSIRHNLCLP